MEQESELQRLEKFVEKILTRFSLIKAEKGQLEQEVFERDLLIEELRENISSKVTERNEISERVNKIVDQIEDWEQNLEQGEDVTKTESYAAPAHSEEGVLPDTQETEDGSDEEERRMQHDLFSMSGSKE
ncbi:MAG: hypothetical protein GY799_01105 [Desulfobulbaceae bacterium]|nr:hypothetical protein [Desulfobulbaceae bacterium]